MDTHENIPNKVARARKDGAPLKRSKRKVRLIGSSKVRLRRWVLKK